MAAQILVVGCGAIGGLFAAALPSVAKVTAFDANAEHVRVINAQGLRVTGKNQQTARIEATDDPAALKGTAFDAVIFLIKSKMTAAALAQLRPALTDNPMLVTLQNGMGPFRQWSSSTGLAPGRSRSPGMQVPWHSTSGAGHRPKSTN